MLSRFIGAAEESGIDGVVRICSDNPIQNAFCLMSRACPFDSYRWHFYIL